MKTKKLTKKQELIIDTIKKAIDCELSVMRDFYNEGDYKLVTHCQQNILSNLSGIASYIIFSNNKVWDERLKNAYHDIRRMPELHYSYPMKCLENSQIKEKQNEK